MRTTGCILGLLILLLLPGTGRAETLRYAVFPAPPYMIEAEESQQAKDALSGIDVDIVREIARRMNLDLAFVRCPWLRCLDLMETGDADLLSSAYKKPDRERFMHYLTSPYLNDLPISFYVRKGSGIRIARYEDLYQLDSVGVLRGAGYFERFDNDARIRKYEVASQAQLFPMLISGRIQAMAGYVPTENYRLKVQGYAGSVEKTAYVYDEDARVYLAISRKSPLASRLAEFDRVHEELLREGFIARVIEAYSAKYSF